MSLPPDLPPFEPPVPPESSAPGTPQASPPSVAHAWISEPASATSRSQSRAGGLIVVVLVVVLAALIFTAVKLGGPLLSRIEIPDLSGSDRADTSSKAMPELPAESGNGQVGAPQHDYVIGADLAAGTYRLAQPLLGADQGETCSFVLTDEPVVGDDGFSYSYAFSGGRGGVTLADGEYWSTYNCGEWEGVNVDSLFATPDDAAESFGMGAWLVGADIRPGA